LLRSKQPPSFEWVGEYPIDLTGLDCDRYATIPAKVLFYWQLYQAHFVAKDHGTSPRHALHRFEFERLPQLPGKCHDRRYQSTQSRSSRLIASSWRESS